MSIPQHPDQDDQQVPDRKPVRTQTKIIIAAIIIAVVIVMIVIHVTGIAPHQ